MASSVVSPMRNIPTSFTDDSGAPLPGGLFPGSFNTNLTGLSYLSEDHNGFQWSVSNVTLARGGDSLNGVRTLTSLEGQDYPNSNSSQEAQASISVADNSDSNDSKVADEDNNGADNSVSEAAPELTAEMASDMFRRISGAAYSTSAFIFGDPQHQNPLISLQVDPYHILF